MRIEHFTKGPTAFLPARAGWRRRAPAVAEGAIPASPGPTGNNPTVDVASFGQRFLHGELARQRGEVAVAHFDLDGVGAQPAALEPVGNVGRLFAQTGTKHLAVVGVVQKGFPRR